jgi:hypothetical protein
MLTVFLERFILLALHEDCLCFASAANDDGTSATDDAA